MDDAKQKILNLFKQKGGEISTGEILGYVYPESKAFKDKEDTASKRKKAQLHRKLLYHINELTDNGIIRFTKFGEKGLKFFTLDISEGEEITAFTSKYKKRMTISRPAIPAMPIEGYEHQGIIIKYEPNSWIDKLNAITIMCERIESLKMLEHVFENALGIVNDCICFENFDRIIDKSTKREAIDLLERINQECSDCNKKVSCAVNVSALNKEKFLEILDNLTEPSIKQIIFIYSLDSEEIQEQFGLINDIVKIYIHKKRTMYVKNKRIHKAPYFLGTAGPYSISEKEWANSYSKDLLSVACSQSALIVDVERFYSLYGLDTVKFSELMLNISKSFLSANSIQRRKSQEYFKSILSLDKKNEKEFLEFSRNYIRFWNFGLLQPGIDSSLVLNMVSEAKKKVDEFSIAEETIYKSCGMPTRFKISLSCAFREADEKLSSAKYRRLEITSLDDLYRARVKKEVAEKENITSMFDGGNDITFHRSGDFNSEDVLREISVIINTYKMPLFSYGFENLKGDTKLTSYI